MIDYSADVKKMMADGELYNHAHTVLMHGDKDQFAVLVETVRDVHPMNVDRNIPSAMDKGRLTVGSKIKALQELLEIVAKSDKGYAHEFVAPLVLMGAKPNEKTFGDRLSAMHVVNRADTLDALVENGGNTHTRSPAGNVLPVHTVSLPEVRLAYMNRGESPQETDGEGRNALFSAQTREDVENMVRTVPAAERKGFVRHKANDGSEALHHAINEDVMKGTLAAGGSFEAKDKRERTPQAWYATFGMNRRHLLVPAAEAGAALNVVDMDGETPVTRNGAADIDRMRSLKRLGGNFDHRDGAGNTMMHRAVGYPDHQANLIEVGASETILNNAGFPPIVDISTSATRTPSPGTPAMAPRKSM